MEDSDELLVYDKENDVYVEMYKISINDKDKAFLQSLYEADGYLNTMEIGDITGIERNLVHYRYDKFGRKRYSEIIEVRNVDKGQLPTKLENMKEARLTDKGRKLIEFGLIDLEKDYLSEDIVLSKEEFESQRELIDTLQTTIGEQQEQINQLEQEVGSLRQDVSSFSQWKDDVETVITALRSSINNLNIDFNKHLEEARDENE